MQEEQATTNEKHEEKNGMKVRTNIRAGETAADECKKGCKVNQHWQQCNDWCDHLG